MICEKCGAEAAPTKDIQLSFTSPRFAEKGCFKPPALYRDVQMHVCTECGHVMYRAKTAEEKE